MALNNNQITFCQEYIKNGNNGTKAYMKVYPGSSEESAMTGASRLLRNDKVQDYLKSLQDKVEKKTIMSAEERMEFLTKVVNGKIKDKVYMGDKLKALDILNKMSGEYVVKAEVKKVESDWFKSE